MKEIISAIHTLLLTYNFVLLNFQYDTSSVLNIWYVVRSGYYLFESFLIFWYLLLQVFLKFSTGI